MYRAKCRDINQRPIRKVAEAQARKRKRMRTALEKLRKTAVSLSAVGGPDDLNAISKARAMKRAIRKSREGKKKTLIVATRGAAGPGKRIRGTTQQGGRVNPKSAKKVKVVDRRMKTDKRGEKRAIKTLKSKGIKPKSKGQRAGKGGKKGRK